MKMKNKNSSICTDCIFARRPWSDELLEKGYIGCFKHLELLKGGINQDEAAMKIIRSGEFAEAATGWVSQAKLGEKNTDNAINGILMTVGATRCAYHETDNED